MYTKASSHHKEDSTCVYYMQDPDKYSIDRLLNPHHLSFISPASLSFLLTLTHPTRSKTPTLATMLDLRFLVSALVFASIINAQVNLGTALSFAVLAGTTVTNTGSSIINGGVGVAPGTAITGFPPGIITNGVIHMADIVAFQSQADLTTAYTIAAGLPPNTDLTGQDLGGKTLVAGVYSFSSSAQLTGSLVLDGQGNSSSTWVFQIGSTLTTATTASVLLINGGSPCNVFWQVGSSATIGTGTTFIGNILALTSITAVTGSSFNGSLYARNGAVTLDTNVVLAGLACPTIGTPTCIYNQYKCGYNLVAAQGNSPYPCD